MGVLVMQWIGQRLNFSGASSARLIFLSARILVIMSSDKVVLVVVVLSAISLSTVVASPITDCSSST